MRTNAFLPKLKNGFRTTVRRTMVIHTVYVGDDVIGRSVVHPNLNMINVYRLKVDSISAAVRITMFIV